MSPLRLPLGPIVATIRAVANHERVLRPIRDELAVNLEQRVVDAHAFNRQPLLFTVWRRERPNLWKPWGLGKRLRDLLDELESRQARGELVAAHPSTEERLRAMLAELDRHLAHRSWPIRLARWLRRT